MSGRGQANLGQLLDGVLANLDLKTKFREHLAVIAWPQVAGHVVAAHAQAMAVRDGVLIVAADTGAWAQELQMRQRELLKLLEAQVGPGVIRDIHFRTGRSRWQRRRVQAEQAVSEMGISRRRRREIEAAGEKIEDEDLRVRAERAFAALARMEVWRKKNGWRRCRRCGCWQRVGRHWCASCTYSGGRRKRR